MRFVLSYVRLSNSTRKRLKRRDFHSLSVSASDMAKVPLPLFNRLVESLTYAA